MDERIDILDRWGQLTGKTCLKSEAHKRGLWHPCVHIWIYNAQNEVLLQQRVKTKEAFPGYWDVSVAGHIETGEGSRIAGLRELSEELGIDVKPDQLEKIGSFSSEFVHKHNFIDREFHDVYLCKLNRMNSEFSLQKEEVSDIKWISVQDLDRIGDFDAAGMVPYPKTYFDLILSSIKNRTTDRQ
jgi:isopentenyldiphosphate isomerase